MSHLDFPPETTLWRGWYRLPGRRWQASEAVAATWEGAWERLLVVLAGLGAQHVEAVVKKGEQRP